MCVATYSVPMATAPTMRGYPAAKKRRPSYGEDYLATDPQDAAGASPVGSEESTQTSCSYVGPQHSTMPSLNKSSTTRTAEPIALQASVVAAEARPAAGWFSKCRGCGCKTAHELEAAECAIPLCVRCQQKVNSLHGDSHATLLANLAHVHACWEQLGM